MTNTTTTPPPLEQSSLGLFDADNNEWEMVSATRGEIIPGVGIMVEGATFRKTGRTLADVVEAKIRGRG